MPPMLQEVHSGRWLQYTQQESEKEASYANAARSSRAWGVAASPLGDLTWLVTVFGNGFTPAGFGNWFRDQCNKAGLQHCSAHGLRKTGAVRAVQNGATMHVLKAIFGWQTTKQAEHYTKSADQMKLAASGMHLMRGGKN
jgi:site-specific recombinase XerD